MKALVMEDYGRLRYTDAPDPRITDGRDVLVRVKAAAICGSDVHGFDGSTGRRKPPIIMGHEAAGVVAAVGPEVTGFAPGDRVTFDSTISCGTCWHCRRGEVNLCDHRTVLGVSCDEYRRDGAFAEYVVAPERVCCRLPEGLSFEEAALTEPAAVAAHAVRLTPVGLNETVAVVGAGLIGLLVVATLRASTAGRIIALDTDPARRAIARQRGADAVFDPADGDVAAKIAAITEGRGADRVFEAVGATAPIRTAVSIVRKGGSVTLIGNVSPSIDLPLQAVVTRQISLLGSCAIAGEYPIVIDLMARRQIDVKPLISRVAPLAEGDLWMNRLYRREDGLLKVVLIP